MADDQVSVRVVVDDSAARAGFERVEVNSQQMRVAILAAGRDVNKALHNLAGLGTTAAKAGNALAAAGERGAAALGHVGGAASGALRELAFIADEVIGGRWSRIPGSLSVMANRVGLLSATISHLGTPIGAAAAVVGLLATAFDILASKAEQAQREIAGAINAAALARGTAVATAEFQRFYDLLTRTGVLSSSAGGTLAEAIMRIPGLAEQARVGIAHLAEPFTQFIAGGDPAKAAEQLTRIFSSAAAMKRFVEENNLLTSSEMDAWEAAKGATGEFTRQQIAVDALAGRFRNFGGALKEAQAENLTAAQAIGALGGGIVPSTKSLLPLTLKMPPPVIASKAQTRDLLDHLLKMPEAKPPRIRMPTAKDDLDKWEHEVEVVYRKAYEAEEQYATAAESRDRTLLRTFEQHMKQMIATKQITLKQAVGFDIEYADRFFAQDKARLEQILADDRLTLDEKRHVYDQLLQLEADHDEQIAALQAQAAQQRAKSWTDSLKPIEDQFATFATNIITRTKSVTKAFEVMMRSIIDDFLKASFRGFFNGLFGSGSDRGGAGSGGGDLLGGFNPFGLLGGAIGGLFKDALGAAIGNPFSSASGGLIGGSLAGLGSSLLGSITGGTESMAELGGGLLGGSLGALQTGLLASAGSLLGKLASMLPSAAGGWVIPQFARGGILSVLHQREMVLPAHLSDGLQSMIAAGGAGGHTINISAVDAAGVARLFRNNGAALVAALNHGMRHGSVFSPAT